MEEHDFVQVFDCVTVTCEWRYNYDDGCIDCA